MRIGIRGRVFSSISTSTLLLPSKFQTRSVILSFGAASIQTVRQEGHADDAVLVLVTHSAPDAALAATVQELRELEIVRDVSSVMRVEGG